MRPHVAGVSPLVEKADEALANPMAAADEMRRQCPDIEAEASEAE